MENKLWLTATSLEIKTW